MSSIVNVRAPLNTTDQTENEEITRTDLENKRALDVLCFDALHTKVHEGKYFAAGYYATGIANGSSIEVLIQTNASYTLQGLFRGNVGGDAEGYLYEGATFSAAGTAVTPVNFNRESATTLNATVTHTPTITGVGTLLGVTYIPGGKGGASVGGSSDGLARDGAEWELSPGTTYLLRLTNTSGSAAPLQIVINAYEEAV